jgi:hypothetical protein
LADTHTETEALSHQVLNLTVVLAVIQHHGEHLSLKLRGVTVAPLDECLLTFTFDAP